MTEAAQGFPRRGIFHPAFSPTSIDLFSPSTLSPITRPVALSVDLQAVLSASVSLYAIAHTSALYGVAYNRSLGKAIRPLLAYACLCVSLLCQGSSLAGVAAIRASLVVGVCRRSLVSSLGLFLSRFRVCARWLTSDQKLFVGGSGQPLVNLSGIKSTIWRVDCMEPGLPR